MGNMDSEEYRSHTQKVGVVCGCIEPQCGKCLSVNCSDVKCAIHTKEAKMAWRKRWEFANKKPFPHPENY